jgi:hypothetical protein
MTGAEMKDIRHGLSEAIGRRLSMADMAKLCGLDDPDGKGRLKYREWEEGDGHTGPVAVLLSLYKAGVNPRGTAGVFMIDYILDHLDT